MRLLVPRLSLPVQYGFNSILEGSIENNVIIKMDEFWNIMKICSYFFTLHDNWKYCNYDTKVIKFTECFTVF